MDCGGRRRHARRRHSASAARALLSGLLALLLACLDVAAAVSTRCAAHRDPPSASALAAPACLSGPHDQADAPRGVIFAASCCPMCGPDGVDATPAPSRVSSRLLAVASGRVIGRERAALAERAPEGWESSWSAQAPPHFS
jgi:hypothetical protein